MRVTIKSKYPYYVARPPTKEQQAKAEQAVKDGKPALLEALRPPWRVVPGPDGDLVITDQNEAKDFLSSPGVQSRLASGMLQVSDLPKGEEFEKLAKGSVRKRASQPKPDPRKLAKSLGVTMRAAGESAAG